MSLSPQKRELQLRFLNELSTSLQRAIESDNFFQAIINIIHSRFDYYAIQFWSVAQDQTATLEAQAGAYDRHLKVGHQLTRDSITITTQVIRKKQSYLCNDTSQDKNFSNLSLPIQSKSQLCIPILIDNEVIATLNVESDQIEAFDEHDVITLEAVASQLSVAMSNRNLLKETLNFNSSLKKAIEVKTVELNKAHERILQQQKLLQKENKALKNLVNKDSLQESEIIGKSPAFVNTITMVDKIAPTTATVLIQGESGTGKELIARRLHFKSQRKANPYVTVNCGALQESLLESELFGHEKGSFTGAVAQKLGLVETCDGGTLFLDEIGEMSLSIQAKLLRFLQEGEFYRIGGKRPIKVNVRVISATNRDLEHEVKESRFREDLFYRLNTITLRMPPLRERKEDISLLVEHFLRQSLHGEPSQTLKSIDSRVLEAFQNYTWPGNIRELQNTVERLKILSEGNEINLEDIPFSIRMPSLESSKLRSPHFPPVHLTLEELEKNHIIKTLSHFKGNKTKTAKNLGITIKTLYNKLHRYDMIETS